jgi:hypothetical protein
MATDLTQELLQGIAVKVVTQFMTKQSSLSCAIADEAKAHELNPEQIKRVIEASNTIAYLRQLEDAHDRSFEFPVAEYRDVMGKMVLPDATSPVVNSTVEPLAPPLAEKAEVTKSAGVKEGPLNAKAPVSQINQSGYDATEYDRDNTQQLKTAMLLKETLRVRSTMQKLAEEGYMVSINLEKLASIVQKDPQGLEKLTHVASPEDLSSLTILCGFEKTAETGSVFTTTELKDAMSLNSLFKEAKEMIATEKEMGDFLERATPLLKEAGILGWGAEQAGKGLGWAARKAVGGGVGLTKGVGAGIAGLAAGKTIGQRLERGGDILGAATAGLSTNHTNPVWKSIHGGE